MTFVKMCGTWYRYPEQTMTDAEHREFQAVVTLQKGNNGQEEVYAAKATLTQIYELGQHDLEMLDEWEFSSAEAAREVKLKRLVQIVKETLVHQDEARELCDDLFADDIYSAVREVFRAKPRDNLSEREIQHLFGFFGMSSED